ncbi:MAG: hypothetical protein ACNFW9_03265 [Candidatus Kerfeldbacteria bacterium]|jgi:hypothetical protein
MSEQIGKSPEEAQNFSENNKDTDVESDERPSDYYLCLNMHNLPAITKEPNEDIHHGPNFVISVGDLQEIQSTFKRESKYTKKVGALLDLYRKYEQDFYNLMIKNIKEETGKTLTEWMTDIESMLKEIPENSNPTMYLLIKDKFNVSSEWGKCLWDAYNKRN